VRRTLICFIKYIFSPHTQKYNAVIPNNTPFPG
jgi:hypothetical protein